jgi:amino acid adenylation domain-containing protein
MEALQHAVEGFRLSPQQERLWLLAQRDPEGDYGSRCAVELRGAVDPERLRRALEAAAAAHEILRTRFERLPGMGIPVQVVEEAGGIAWRVTDLAGAGDVSGEAAEAELRRRLAGGTGRRLSAEGEEVLEADLLRLAADRAVLFLRLPALCADSRSLGNLFSGLVRGYAAGGPGPEGEAAEVPYIQFSEWQNELLDDPEGADHWRARDPSLGRPLRFAFEADLHRLPPFRPAAAALALPAETAAGLAGLAAAAGVPAAAVLLAAWLAFLSRLAADAEPLAGYLFEGRDHELLAAAVGLFARWVPVRVPAPEEVPFADLVGDVARAMEEACQHADSFLWGGGRDPRAEAGGFPAAAFELADWPADESAAGCAFSLLGRSAVCDRFKLKLAATRRGGLLSAELSYDASLLAREDVERVARQLGAVLDRLAAEPRTPVGELDLLTADERLRLVGELNATPPMTERTEMTSGEAVHRRFERQAALGPDRDALVCGDRRLTYGELNRRANQLAHRLRRLGVGPDVPVALCLERSLELVVGLLGILKAGGAYVALDPAQPRARLLLMLEDAAPPALVTQESLAGAFEACRGAAVRLDADLPSLELESVEDPDLPVFPEQLAYIVSTSGSTGRPKGVAVEHRQLAGYAGGVARTLGLPAGGSYATVSTFAADLGNTTVFPALCGGGCLHVVPAATASDAAGMAEYFRRHAIDCLKIVPSHLEALHAAAPAPFLPRLRLVFGGEALRREWAGRLAAAAGECKVFNHYGPSEATVGALTRPVEPGGLDARCPTVPLGRPLPGARVYLLDSRSRPVPRWTPGEIHIGGGGVSRGYFRRPDLTAERFVPDPLSGEPGARLYRTGDLGRFVADGDVEFLGRIDRQVKLHGFRIELDEIRSVLNRHPQVRDSVALVRRDPQGRELLVAYYVARQPADAAELRSFLSEVLLAETLPNVFVHLRRLPLTLNGKIDLEALPSLEEVRRQLKPSFAAPRTPVEEVLAGLWAEALGLERVGVRDDFFELGGHSLIATRLISRVRQVSGAELPLRSLFDHPTVEGLARQVEVAMRDGAPLEAPPIEPAPRDGGPLPLSFAQERLWLMHQLEPESVAYNMPGALRLTGGLAPAALAAALQEIVRRHEVLRTRFESGDGAPRQVVVPAWRPALPQVDLSGIAEEARWSEARRLAREEAERPFDLARLPLLRPTLLRLGEADHALLLTLHHIVADAWSIEVLTRELAELYGAGRAGRPAALPALPVQYADFAVWQRRWLAGEAFDSQLSYWRRQLSGAPESLELPADHPRPAAPSFRGAIHSVRLPLELLRNVEELSRTEKVTPFMTLLAAFATLLHRYTGQTDLVIGTDIANRNFLEIERLIGFFINNLVLRADLSGEPAFRDLLHRVREMSLQAFAHQDLPFDRLVHALRPRRQLARTPLFQVLFVLQPAPLSGFELPGLTVAPLDFGFAMAKFDLALFIRPAEDGLTLAFNYSTDLFESGTIARMAAHYERLLDGICRQPDARLNQLEMLTDMEKREREESNVNRLRSARRRTAEPAAAQELVRMEPHGDGIPLLVQPNVRDLDLVGWAQSQRDLLERKLAEHGAILFRGFEVDGVAGFERFAAGICPDLYGEYGDLPREEEGGKVYRSTPYPPDKSILFHNESSHMHRWPLKQFFCCVQAARQGGATPIVDCRKVYRALPPAVAERFERQGLIYVRTFADGLDVPWQEFFRTADRERVEAYCREAGLELLWRDDGLQTRQRSRAVAVHPRTGEKTFFNQLQLHHASCLEPEVRDSMRALFGEEAQPRNVLYGDGSPIEDAVMAEVSRVYEQLAVRLPWREGDVLMLDNMLAAHARDPYVGPRKIVVAMGEIVYDRSL